MKRFIIPIIIVAILGLIGFLVFQPSTAEKQDAELSTVVKEGPFNITINATGELNAKKSVKIRGPKGMRTAGIYETTIARLAPEGTILQKGDYVATLDRTEIANKMSNVQSELDKIQSQLAQAKIDTAIELKDLRDQLVNMEFSKAEKLLKLEENKYEPQSVIKAAEIDLERSERDYKQLINKYDLKKIQAAAKIEEIRALQRQNQMQMDLLNEISQGFTVTAPEDGMLIYSRTWRGKKEPGSRVSGFDPVVAELPDLSDMISKTYVNEVDISKVMEGQEVKMQVDAFPETTYSGKVIKVANIGEQLRGYDAKVFEVIVQINEIDSVLRPAMTTSIEIITNTFDKVLYLPLEAIYTDSLTYVYKKTDRGIVKQEVIPGLSNDTEMIIHFGLNAGEEVLLTPPQNEEELSFASIDGGTKSKVLKQQEIADRERLQEALQKKASMRNVTLPENGGSGGGDFIIIN